MRAGVSRAFSRRRARCSGVGRQRRRTSRTASGISIQRSWLTSCLISSIGKSGARSWGPIGWPVPGCRGGASGVLKSAWMLYQRVGSSFSERRYLVVMSAGLRAMGRPPSRSVAVGLMGKRASQYRQDAKAVKGGDRVDDGRLAPRLELRGAVGFHPDALAEAGAGVLVDQDRTTEHLRVRLQVGGQVHGVAHPGIGHALLGAGEAGHERPGGDADPDLDLHPAAAGLVLVEAVHQLQHLEGRAHRPLAMVGTGEWGP